jgi:hypothetical protein
MNTIDPARLLGYGAIGFGFLLAFLSYLLLSGEQKREEPRKSMVRAIYSFMAFAFFLSFLGFGSELLKNGVMSTPAGSFTDLKPLLRSPTTRSEFSYYPRDLDLVWEELPGAVAYRVKTELQANGQVPNSVAWYPVETRVVRGNRCSITFGGAQWGRWQVSAIGKNGEETQESDWWTFHFTE